MTDLIEVKTADLVGEALGWAVGKAEGLNLELVPPQYGNPWR
ncbi:phage protein NinX family protein, partial [Pseudomonas sp.]